MERFADSFSLLPEAQSLVQRLQLLPQLQHTTGARILCVQSQQAVILRGDPCKAFIGPPKVQGPLRHLFAWFLSELARPVLKGEDPEFLVLIDAALWASSTPPQRERTIYHELKHLVVKENGDRDPCLHEDGRFQLRTTRHDIEAFDDEIRRYGPDACEIESTVQAIVDGAAAARQRGKRRADRSA